MRDDRHDGRQGGPHLRGAVLAERRLVRRLPAVARSAQVARAVVRIACRTWECPDACDTAALVTSELVAHSVRHASTRSLDLRLSQTPRRLRVEVADGEAAPPRLVPRPLLEEDGLALVLVAELAVRWGARPAGTGSAVWAEIALP